MNNNMTFSCDVFLKRGWRCGKKPYVEVYWKGNKKETFHWAYLCRWHYYIDRIRNLFYKQGHGYAVADDVDVSEVNELGRFFYGRLT